MGPHGWQWLLILAIILLLFGAAKVPALAKSLGPSARVFKGEMKAMKDDDTTTTGASAASGDNSAASTAASTSDSPGDSPRTSS